MSVETNSTSENNKLLASAAFQQPKCQQLKQDREVGKVETNCIEKDGQKIMLKLGENNLVSLKKFAKGIMYYVKKTKKK